jgi:hypothetical protein
MKGKGIYLGNLNSLMVEDFEMSIEDNKIIIKRENSVILVYDSIYRFLVEWRVLEHDRSI